jgi:hypothetical protein
VSLQARFKKSALVTVAPKHITGVHDEPHYSPSYWAKKWGFSENFIRQRFRDEPGVIKIVRPEDLKTKKRAYVTLKIPTSVAIRVHERLHGKIGAN